MLRLKLILFISVLSIAAYSQTGTIANGESGSSVRTKLNATITKANNHADSIIQYRIELDAIIDSLVLHLDSIKANRAAILLNDAELSDIFDSLRVHHDAIALNTAKVTNVSTALSLGTISGTTVSITSDGSSDDVTIPAATTDDAGLLTAALFDEIDANTAKSTNVPTALSVGTNTTTELSITSDGGADDVTLPLASTSLTGVVNSATYDAIVAATPVNYAPTAIVFGNATQNYDIDGVSWNVATAGVPDAANHLLPAALASIATAYDNSYLAVREFTGAASATNPLTITFTFPAVTSFNVVKFRSRYVGSSSHNMVFELYNGSTWDTFITFSNETAYNIHSAEIWVPAPYLIGGVVTGRFRHLQSGVATHYELIDFLVVASGGGSGGNNIQTAFQTPSSATGTIAATNVQSAIAELDGDISAKETNVSTALSEGTRTSTTYGITSDGGEDDIALPEATTDYAGLLSADKFDEINNASDSIVVHRDFLYDILTRLTAAEDLLYGYVPTPSDAILQIYYKFEQNVEDQTSYNRDGTASAGFIYSDLESGQENFMGNFNASTSYVTTPVIDVSAYFGVAVTAYVGNDSAGNRFLVGNAGWSLEIETDTKRIKFITSDGGSTDSIYTAIDAFRVDSILPHRSMRIFAVSDGTIFINGVEASTSGSIVSGFTSSGAVLLGQNVSGGEVAYCYMDELKIWKGTGIDSTFIVDEYKGVYPERALVDVLSPSPVSAYTNDVNPELISLSFSESLYNFISDSVKGAFSYTMQGVTKTIDSVTFEPSGSILMVYVDTIKADSTLLLGYNSAYYSGLEDFAENKVGSFVSFPVTNNIAVSEVTAAILRYRMENNNDDEVAANDFLFNTSPTYTSETKKEGSFALRVTDSGNEIYPPPTWRTNGDSLPPRGNLTFWFLVTGTDNNEEVMATANIATGEGLQLKVSSDAGDDIIMVFETANSNNEIRADNVNGGAWTTSQWYHISVNWNNPAGTGKIYFEGVDETDDAAGDANIDLSGPIVLFSSTIRIDDPQWYDDTLSATEVLYLKEHPGETIMKSGTPTPPDPVTGQTAFSAYADSIWAFDFNESTLGYYPVASLIAETGAEWVNSEMYANNIATGEQRPYIVYDTFRIAGGALDSSKCLRGTQVEGTVADQGCTPIHFRVKIEPRVPENEEMFVSFNVRFPSDDWLGAFPSDGTPGKIMNYTCGYYRDEDGIPLDGSRKNTSGAPHYHSFTNSVIFKDNYPGTNHRLTNYIYNGDPDVWASTPAYYDPDNVGSNLLIDDTEGNDTWHNITMRVYLGTINGYDGFIEAFIDGSKCYGMYDMKLRDVAVVLDALFPKYHWGSSNAPTKDVNLLMDDIYVFRYKDLPGFYKNQAWPAAVNLKLPMWDSDNGVRIKR